MNSDKQKPTKYQQVKQDIINYIEKMDLQKTGECLPAERELCEMFGASRMTVRKAVDEMEEEKLLYRLKGKGTFVKRKDLISQSLTQLTGFSEDMQTRGKSAGSRILLCEMTAATKTVAEKLNIDAGDEVVILRRLRLADDEPVAIETCYLPGQLCGKILDEPLGESLYAYMRGKLNIHPIRAMQSIEVGVLLNWEADLLEAPDQKIALLTHRQTFDANGQPIEYTISKYRSDRYKYYVELSCEQT